MYVRVRACVCPRKWLPPVQEVLEIVRIPQSHYSAFVCIRLEHFVVRLVPIAQNLLSAMQFLLIGHGVYYIPLRR